MPAAAFLVAVLGAAAIMVSPITSWMAAVEVCGAVGAVTGTTVLILWLLRRRW
jgi:hypothetical protein